MKTVQFLSNSPQVKSIIKGLSLTKSLMVSSIIIGEPYTGKKSLVQNIFPKASFVNGGDKNALCVALDNHDEIVIYNFESIVDTSTLDFSNKRVIAISDSTSSTLAIEEKFAFIYKMPTLHERPEDVSLLIEYFSKSIKKELMIESDQAIEIDSKELKENIKSLKAAIYRQLITSALDRKDIEKILFQYLSKHIDGNNAYRDYLGIYERPLIKAGLKKFKSQLKLSSVLGLNRNTLRKKIYEHNID